MKKVISIFIFLLLFITSNAQTGLPLAIEDPKMDGYLQNRHPATLILQINNAPDTIKKFDVECTFVSFGSNFQITKYYSIDSSGFLKIVLHQNLPYQQVFLLVKDYLYSSVYVNSNLKVTIDVSKIKNKDGIYFSGDGVDYSGIDGELNAVMNKHILYQQDLENKLTSNLNQLCSSRRGFTSDVFFTKTDSIWKALNKIDNEFTQQHPKYAWAINNETASKFYGQLCTSYWGDTMPNSLLKKINNHKPYFTSNDGVLFYNYLNSYHTIKISGVGNDINKIDRIYSGSKADVLKTFLLAKGKDSFAVTYPEILTSIKTEWCQKLVSNELREMATKQKKIDSLLASGHDLKNQDEFIGTPIEQLPFNASLYKLDSIRNVNDFIRNLKSKFKNKALVIDFWATWCVPCLHEMPMSKKLHEANKDLPIQYIYICTNSSSNIKVWKNKIAELRLPGTHIFMDKKIVEELKSSFDNAGSGFPTYVVVDANGKLRPNAIQWMEVLNRNKLKLQLVFNEQQ